MLEEFLNEETSIESRLGTMKLKSLLRSSLRLIQTIVFHQLTLNLELDIRLPELCRILYSFIAKFAKVCSNMDTKNLIQNYR